VRLLIADDGKGFRMRGAPARGFGLMGMQDRARAAGGRAIVRSTPGRGTTISVVLDAP
jgi:signal transduction histidine kinase